MQELLSRRAYLVDELVAGIVGGGARLLDWSVQELPGGGGGNPTSGGIFRLSGRAQCGASGSESSALPWSVVLKVLRLPDGADPAYDSPAGPFYWRREADIFSADPGLDLEGLTHPRVFSVFELPPDVAWLWLEDLGDFGPSAWEGDRYEAAARALGRFQARYLVGHPIPDHLSLARDFERGHHAAGRRYVQDIMARAGRGGDAFRPLNPELLPPDVARVVAIAQHPEPVFEVLDALPQTLCHNDANVGNLLMRAGADDRAELVVIDWQTLGPGALGTDLGPLLYDVGTDAQDLRAAIEEASLRAYWRELVSAGAQVELSTVRFGFAAVEVLRLSVWAFWVLYESLEAAEHDEEAVARFTADFVDQLARGHLPRLASEVTQRVERTLS